MTTTSDPLGIDVAATLDLDPTFRRRPSRKRPRYGSVF